VYNDKFIFAEESEKNISTDITPFCWKILIVDDEPDVHVLTKKVLEGFKFNGKAVSFLSAYSEEETKKCFHDNPDIAVVFLDVVMEGIDSGLKLVKYIRENLNNKFVRIILRTGQPGNAPEERIITNYDINDYKEKTELTSRKLFTVLISSLRAYNDIMIIEANKKGLEKIIDASATIFKLQSFEKLASGILTQLTSILKVKSDAVFCQRINMVGNEAVYRIFAASGKYYDFLDGDINKTLSDSVLSRINKAIKLGISIFEDNFGISMFRTENGNENFLYFETWHPLENWETDLLKIFLQNVSLAFDNIYLHEEITDTQKEIILTLSEIVEGRSNETGNHVNRVAQIGALIATKLGLPESEVELIKLASPMHDIGKLGIPDSILNKPDKLDKNEYDVIKMHTTIGYKMLKKSNRKILKAAAIIALQHQEKFDGTGYPNSLKGEDIHIYARIISIADVFDALCNDRIYRKAVDVNEVINIIQKGRGTHFDPKIVDVFMENIETIISLTKQ